MSLVVDSFLFSKQSLYCNAFYFLCYGLVWNQFEVFLGYYLNKNNLASFVYHCSIRTCSRDLVFLKPLQLVFNPPVR